MSQSPFSIQQLPISRSILLPASFAAGGALLLILFAALMGCALLADADRWPRSEPQDSPNAVLSLCASTDASSGTVTSPGAPDGIGRR